MGEDRVEIAGNEHFPLPEADDNSTSIGDTSGHEHTRLLPEHRDNSRGALDLGDGGLDCGAEVAAVLQGLGDEVRNDLRVCLRDEDMAESGEASAQLGVVLDDAVM